MGNKNFLTWCLLWIKSSASHNAKLNFLFSFACWQIQCCHMWYNSTVLQQTQAMSNSAGLLSIAAHTETVFVSFPSMLHKIGWAQPTGLPTWRIGRMKRQTDQHTGQKVIISSCIDLAPVSISLWAVRKQRRSQFAQGCGYHRALRSKTKLLFVNAMQHKVAILEFY